MRAPGDATARLLETYGFGLDDFQIKATDAVDDGRSVLVSAPTGSGKTVVAEYAIAATMDRGLRAFYTTPIKALSNQKFADLRHIYGPGRVGLLTGDNTVDGDAPVVVMTTEVLRNMIYTGRTLDDLGVVVLDEVHYLQNTFRGPVWEEVIIHLPEHVQLVCLSATVSNAQDIGDWLTTVRGDTEIVVEETRPVELTSKYLVGDRATGQAPMIDVLKDGLPNPEGRRFDRDAEPAGGRRGGGRGGSHGRGQSRGGGGRGPRRRWLTPRRSEVVDILVAEELIPAIYFIFSRNGCDEAVRACLDGGITLTTPEEQSRISAIADHHLEALGVADLEALGVSRWRAGLLAGVAAHHAGHVPPFKEAVEACFVEGLVKVVFATETLAMGINMPARAVVIERMTKFNGESREFLTPSEYTQLTGRAGRRGIDESGTAVVLWSPFVAFGDVASLASSRSFVLRSAFRPTYNMAVNLIRRHDRDEAHHLLNQSLAQYQSNGAVVRAERRRRKKLETLKRTEAKRTSGAKKRIRRLQQEIADIDTFIDSELDTLAQAFDTVLDLLDEWGFVNGWSVTDRGQLLAGIYHESDLAAAEAVATGLFDDLDAPELAAVASTLVYEHRSPNAPPRSRHPSRRVADRAESIHGLINRLRAAEDRRDIPLTRAADDGFCYLAHEWCAGRGLGDLLDATDLELSGGDFVRTIRQLADLVRQIGQVAPNDSTRATARRAVSALDRGVVAASTPDDEAAEAEKQGL